MATDNPFLLADATIHSFAEGSYGQCPCDWTTGESLIPDGQARQLLEAHLRAKHPEYKRRTF